MVPISSEILVSVLRSRSPNELRVDGDIVPSVPDFILKLLSLIFLRTDDRNTFLTSMLQISSFTSNSDVVVVSMQAFGCLASLEIVLQGLIHILRGMVCHMVFVNQVIVNFPFDNGLVLIF